MTKEEYTEFLNLQEHFEWLHAAEDRAKTRLEKFASGDSELDELVRVAVKAYFENEIDKAWKQIEEFKTAPTFVANREDAIRYRSEKRDDVLIFRGCGIDGTRILKRGVIEAVHTICGGKSCLRHACPLFGSPRCTTILKMYMAGKYDVMVNIKEE